MLYEYINLKRILYILKENEYSYTKHNTEIHGSLVGKYSQNLHINLHIKLCI